MNAGLEDLPDRADVIVIGAGPAGSAAAQVLARGGLDVVLVDQHAFPRDKVCGDGLIPDAHRALDRLGVLADVMREARASSTLGCIGPRGGRIDVPGRLAVLPRKRLDHIICRAAIGAGARMFAPVRFVAPIRDDAGADVGADATPLVDGSRDVDASHRRMTQARVVGARLQQGERTRDVAARWVILATGAQPQALIAAGMCERRTPSGIALRGYIRNAALRDRITSLEVVWHRRLVPGYGWIFPCGDDVFNVGVGVASTIRHKGEGAATRRPLPDINLRDSFAAFQAIYPPARDLVAGGQWLAPPSEALKGAPLRCSLDGARFAVPGLLVTGEAAGSMYAFTGEGIGKAMETAMHAADAILAPGSGADDAAVMRDYVARLDALRPRFVLYEEANRANERPWLVDLLVWSAKRSPRRLERMAGVLEETHIPTDAVSLRGILRRLFDWR